MAGVDAHHVFKIGWAHGPAEGFHHLVHLDEIGAGVDQALPAAEIREQNAIDQKAGAIIRFLLSVIFGRLGKNAQKGIHLERGDTIRIEGEGSNVLMDGELFSAQPGHPIVLKSTKPVSFLRLAA